jgi:AcrR family transcriptional regulator
MAPPHDPRANQKERTRAAIVQAATRLLRSGATPSVAAAAEAAKVSRATAYRYFPTPESLQLEIAGVTPAFEPVEQLVGTLQGGDVEARLAAFSRTINAVSFDNEAQMRMALKVYLDTWFQARGEAQAPPVREGRRMRWLEEVLRPAKKGLPAKQWRRLQAALALTVGPDAMVIMKDVCRLGDEEAQEALQWAAQALLRGALQGLGPEGAARRRSLASART